MLLQGSARTQLRLYKTGSPYESNEPQGPQTLSLPIDADARKKTRTRYNKANPPLRASVQQSATQDLPHLVGQKLPADRRQRQCSASQSPRKRHKAGQHGNFDNLPPNHRWSVSTLRRVEDVARCSTQRKHKRTATESVRCRQTSSVSTESFGTATRHAPGQPPFSRPSRQPAARQRAMCGTVPPPLRRSPDDRGTTDQDSACSPATDTGLRGARRPRVITCDGRAGTPEPVGQSLKALSHLHVAGQQYSTAVHRRSRGPWTGNCGRRVL
jgi:hypothetical protein